LKEHLKTILIGLSVFPMFVIFYLLYTHAISLLDPILSLGIGGLFLLALVVVVVKFLINLKDFIVSIFKDKKEVDERGFKKF
jgi:hypothetical protein